MKRILAQQARLSASSFDATSVYPVLALPSLGAQPLLDALEAVRGVAGSSAGYTAQDRLQGTDGIVCPLRAGSFGSSLGTPSLPVMLDFGQTLPHPPPLPDVVTYYWHRASDPTDGLRMFITACILCRIGASWWYSLSVDNVLCELHRPLLNLIVRSYYEHGGAAQFPEDLSAAEREEHTRIRPYLKAFYIQRWAEYVPVEKRLSNEGRGGTSSDMSAPPPIHPLPCARLCGASSLLGPPPQQMP